jgi:hypothetical protein
MRSLAFLAAGVLFSGPLCAGEFIVPLPDLKGHYAAGTTRTASFDVGHPFTAIRSARIEAAGIHTLGWCGGVECSLHQCSLFYSAALESDTPFCSCCWKTSGALDEQGPDFYEHSDLLFPNVPWCSEGDWEFLLDGSSEVSLSFHHGTGFCTVLTPGSASVSHAYLILDADAAGVSIATPYAGQMLLAGDDCEIQWEDFIDPACQGDYLLQFSDDDGQSWLPIGSVGQACAYAWQIPDVTSSVCFVKLIKDDGSGIEAAAGPFSIYQCQVDLPGDLEKDCYVNLADLAILVANWLVCANPLDIQCTP